MAARDLDDPALPLATLRTRLGEAACEDRRDRDARLGAGCDRCLDRGCVDENVGVIDRAGRVADAGESGLTLYGRAVRIDRIDRSGVAVLAQKSQRPSSGLVGVIGDADQRYRARLEQRLGEARPRHAQPQLRVQQSVQMMITPFGCRVL